MTAERATVFHQAFRPGNGGCFFNEIGEFYFHMGGFGMKLFPDFFQNHVKCFDIDLSTEFVEDFHKPAHVRSLELMGKADVHINCGIDRLGPLGAIQNDNRVFNALYANFLDVDLSVILLILDINHHNSRYGHFPIPRRSHAKPSDSWILCCP